jgi:hypothetical protein
MHFDTPRCPVCGQLARGVWESAPGLALLAVNAKGHAEYQGETEMDWDGQSVQLDEEGCATLECPNGHRWPSSMDQDGSFQAVSSDRKESAPAKTTLTVDVSYDPELTDPEGLACAMDRLLETILSTPGIMEEYGDPQIGPFLVTDTSRQAEARRRFVLFDLDTSRLITTRVYLSYAEAAEDASQADDILVVPLIVPGISV